MLKKILMLAALLISTSVIARAPPVPLVDPPVVAVPEATAAAVVEKAIIGSGVRRGWTVIERQPGAVTLRYSPRGFSVTVKVSYDAKGVNVRYADSYDMEYGNQGGHAVIHPNYNRWVNNLAHDIEGEMMLSAIK